MIRSKQKANQTENQVEVFANILAKIETDSSSLSKIEKNTAALPKLVSLLSKGVTRKATGYHEKDARQSDQVTAIATAKPAKSAPQAAIAPIVPITVPPVEKSNAPKSSAKDPAIEPVKSAKPAKPAPQTAVAQVITNAQKKRDNKGRFQPKEKSAGERAQEKAQDDKKGSEQAKSIGTQIKDALKGGADHLLSAGKDKVNELDTTEAAGRAAGGPIFDAAKELQGAAADIKKNAQDESTLTGKAWRYVQSKRSKGEQGVAVGDQPATVSDEKEQFAAPVISEMKAETKRDEKRHKELIKAISGGRKKDRSNKLPARNVRLSRGAGIRPPTMGAGEMMPGLARMIGPAIAVAVAAAVGVAIGTGISKALDYGAQKLTGDKNATAGGATYDLFHGKDVKGIRDVIGQVESGGKGYSAYQNKDSGIVSAGKYQFTAQSGSLANVLDNYSAGGGAKANEARRYSEIMKSGKAESLRNDSGFKGFVKSTGNEKAMQDAQEKTFDKSYFNPAMGYAQKQGINVARMPKLAGMMVDTKIQGGMEEVTQSTKARLSAQGKDFKTASEDEILNIYTDERKKRLDRVANVKAAKGDMASANMNRSSKERVDVVRNTLDKNEGKLRENASEMAVAGRKDQAEAIAVSKPSDFEAKKAAFIATEQGIPQQLAKSSPRPIKTAEPIKTPPPAPVTANVPEVKQLAEAMQEKKPPLVQQKPVGNAVPMIRTEFDDTMLTLMAYDRV